MTTGRIGFVCLWFKKRCKWFLIAVSDKLPGLSNFTLHCEICCHQFEKVEMSSKVWSVKRGSFKNDWLDRIHLMLIQLLNACGVWYVARTVVFWFFFAGYVKLCWKSQRKLWLCRSLKMYSIIFTSQNGSVKRWLVFSLPIGLIQWLRLVCQLTVSNFY